jgi:hypothetical protein
MCKIMAFFLFFLIFFGIYDIFKMVISKVNLYPLHSDTHFSPIGGKGGLYVTNILFNRLFLRAGLIDQ